MQRKQSKKFRRGKNRNHQENKRVNQALGFSKTRQTLLNVGRTGPDVYLKAPSGPKAGAQYTTREVASTFNTQVGLSGVGGTVAGQMSLVGATPLNVAIGFRMDDLGNSASYAALFDQYRIEKVKLHVKSRNSNTFLANTASPNGSIPVGYAVVDRDDSAAPASPQALMQYDNVLAFNGAESFTIELVPTITSAVFGAGAFSGYSTRDSDSMWIDMANTDVIMYGVKISVSNLTASTTSSWTWDIVPEYVVSFRKTR